MKRRGSAIKLPQVMVGVFVNKPAHLFFCHFSKKPVFKIIVRKIGIFAYQGYSFVFPGINIAGSFAHYKIRTGRRVFAHRLFILQ